MVFTTGVVLFVSGYYGNAVAVPALVLGFLIGFFLPALGVGV